MKSVPDEMSGTFFVRMHKKSPCRLTGAKDVLLDFGNYSFTPPRATPAMMNFERMKYTTTIGMIDNVIHR